MKRLLLVVAACTPSDRPHWQAAGHSEPIAGGTLHVATAERAATLDPMKAGDEVSIYVVHAMYDTLLDYAPSGALAPRLASAWHVSEDGLTYTFEIDPTYAFPDGTRLRAEHVATSLERARRDKDALANQYVANIASIDARDRTLVIRLAAPDPTFAGVMAMPFSTPQLADHPPTDTDSFGVGPYTLASREPIVLTRRPTYPNRTRARLDTIELREHVPPELASLMFDRGELDIIDHLAAPDLQFFRAHEAWAPSIRQATQLATFGWRMDTRRKPFDDKRVRQALNYADDKQHVVKLLGGTAIPTHGILPRGIHGADTTLSPYPHDVAKARGLLAEAGYPDGFSVTLVTYAGDEPERLAASFQADLAAIGVTARIETMDFASFQAAITGDNPPPLSLGAWQGDFADPAAYVDVQFESHSPQNNTHYASAELDRLVAAAKLEHATARRDALYEQADRLLRDDAPWVWEYQRITTEIVQPYVRGYAIDPVWVRDFTTAWLDVGPDGRIAR